MKVVNILYFSLSKLENIAKTQNSTQHSRSTVY